MNNCDIALGLLAGLAGAGHFRKVSWVTTSISEKDTMEAIITWLAAIQSGNFSKAWKVLASEFQTLRSDGTRHSSKRYIGDLLKQTNMLSIGRPIHSYNEKGIVARYNMHIDQTTKSKPVQTVARRLSVFPRCKSSSLVVAQANFARTG